MNKRFTISRIITLALAALVTTNMFGMDGSRKRLRNGESTSAATTSEEAAAAALCALSSGSNNASRSVTTQTEQIPQTEAVSTQTDDATPLGRQVLDSLLRQKVRGYRNVKIASDVLRPTGASEHIRPFIRYLVCQNHFLLHAAAGNGHTDTARLLLEQGASVDAKAEHDRTPLHAAAVNGRTDTARLLLEQGASVDAKTRGGATPLAFAANNGHTDTVRLLLEQGADPSHPRTNDKTPLDDAHDDTIKTMLKEAINRRTSTALLSLQRAHTLEDANKIDPTIQTPPKPPREMIELIIRAYRGEDISRIE